MTSGAGRVATLFTHSDPPNTGEASRYLGALSKELGWRIVADPTEIAGAQDLPPEVELSTDLPHEADLCLVLGGDGSILRALRHHVGTETPVFGLNFGTVGFLAAAGRDDLEGSLRRALTLDFEVLAVPALSLAAGGRELPAFNDVTFARRPHRRVAELSYRIAGEEVGHVSCDGLVVATPTGSTGYNLANNGPILAWGVEGYVVSYIAPHTLTARALVVAPRDILTVGNAASVESVELVIDGHPVGELDAGAEADVIFRSKGGCLAQLPGTSFYHRIREKFGHLAV